MAHWLAEHGFSRVSVLAGGLPGWRRGGFATEPLGADDTPAPTSHDDAGAPMGEFTRPLLSLAERQLRDGTLPTRARLATLFVDIAGSTRLLAHHPPETVLGCVQRFMRLVTEVALVHCGDVKDFEGDGALLYFESTAEALQAALAIRTALAAGVCDVASCPVAARMSVTVGDVVVGIVGSPLRHAAALVGPSVSVGARLLKQVAPGGIVASGELVEALRLEAPRLAEEFRLVDPAFEVPATDGIRVAIWAIAPALAIEPARPAGARAARLTGLPAPREGPGAVMTQIMDRAVTRGHAGPRSPGASAPDDADPGPEGGER